MCIIIPFLFFIGIQLEICYSTDPCFNPKALPRANYRGGKCTFNAKKPVCDRDLQHPEPAWYRAYSSMGDVLLQTTPPNFGTCGTNFPYWMNGSLPSDADGEVERDVCAVDLNSNCSSVVKIKVKSCAGFYVYKLPSLQSCPEAYCFGQNEPCPPFDPCDFYENKKVEYDTSRSKDAMCAPSDQCGTLNTSIWYKFAGGEDLLTFINRQRAINCTSDRHTWIKGTPAILNGISNHVLCVEQGNETCIETYTVASKQCGRYSVYKLPDIANLNTCAKICLDSVNLVPSWYTCRAPEKHESGEKHKTGHAAKKSAKDYLWTIGLVAGVAIGAIAATVVVLKFTKQRARAKKVGTSDEDLQKQKPGQGKVCDKGNDAYAVY